MLEVLAYFLATLAIYLEHFFLFQIVMGEREVDSNTSAVVFVQFLAVTFKGCSLLSEMQAQIFADVILRRCYRSCTCCGEDGIV